MSSKKKLLILISGIILVTLSFFAFRYVNDRRKSADERFYGPETSKGAEKNGSQEIGVEEENPGEFLNVEDKIEDDKEEEEAATGNEEEPDVKDSFIDVKKSDCDVNCQKYKSDQEDFNYCREVCGLKEISEKESVDECEDLEGLEEDYCLRDVAIKKLDYAICNKIEDAGIQKMCHNRITEERVDNISE